MPSLFLLLPISLVLVLAIGAAFWWAIFAGQFDDTQEAAHSILRDDDTPSDDVASAQPDPEDRGGPDSKPDGA
ncbi:cbb3-type cytochrome oxidase assembly protein CcoS [Parapusillimonas sp. SGNA-6]|jgi:cbb3-type cytochrome oxidase maturation protein|nr:cbb3-type cytochrome oxidase assembly protein CcoS [Parapusillimonas sp. SGNA-6]